MRYYPNIYGDFCTFNCFSLDTEDQIFQLSNSYRCAIYTLPSPAQAISHPSTAPGGLVRPPLAVSPLIELELRGKNERVARRETKRLIYKLEVLGQPVVFKVRSSTERCRKPVIADNFAYVGATAKVQRPACSLRRVEHDTMVADCPWMISRGQKIEKSFSGHMTSLTFDDPVVT